MIREVKICLFSLGLCVAATVAACVVGVGEGAGWPLSRPNLMLGLNVGAVNGMLAGSILAAIALATNARFLTVGISASVLATVIGFAFCIWCAAIASC